MKKTLRLVLGCCLLLMSGCKQQQKREYTDNYTLKYFYLEGCSNCENFTKNGLPLIEEEFGEHMKIIKYDMDDRENSDMVKKAYDDIVNNIIDFNQDDYGYGPFLVFDGYFAQLGVSDVDRYLTNLINAIDGKKLSKPGTNETYYYFIGGKVKEES